MCLTFGRLQMMINEFQFPQYGRLKNFGDKFSTLIIVYMNEVLGVLNLDVLCRKIIILGLF